MSQPKPLKLESRGRPVLAETADRIPRNILVRPIRLPPMRKIKDERKGASG
jgi:hypothetical protein